MGFWGANTGNILDPHQRLGGSDCVSTEANTHAARFQSASSQHATRAIGSCVGVNMTGDRAIHTWMKLDSLPGSGVIWGIVAVWDSDGPSYNYVFTVRDVSGTKYVAANTHRAGGNNAGVRWDMSSFTLTDWLYLAWVYDASEPQATENELWVNGASQGNGTIFSAANNDFTSAGSGIDFDIAHFNAAGTYLDGRLDCVTVYDAKITEAQIQDRQYKQPKASWDDIQAGYKFDGEVWTDVTGNNELTPQNSPTFVTDTPF